jgi:hypothetical protein
VKWDIRVQEALADMLKVPWRERPVNGFDLTVRVGEVPRVAVYYDVFKDEHIDQTVGVFEVWAVGGTLAPAFDLDAAVEKARQRVAEHVDKLCETHRFEMRMASTPRPTPLRGPFWATEEGENYTNMVGYAFPDEMFRASDRNRYLVLEGIK